jgi:hypothetical protein
LKSHEFNRSFALSAAPNYHNPSQRQGIKTGAESTRDPTCSFKTKALLMTTMIELASVPMAATLAGKNLATVSKASWQRIIRKATAVLGRIQRLYLLIF